MFVGSHGSDSTMGHFKCRRTGSTRSGTSVETDRCLTPAPHRLTVAARVASLVSDQRRTGAHAVSIAALLRRHAGKGKEVQKHHSLWSLSWTPEHRIIPFFLPFYSTSYVRRRIGPSRFVIGTNAGGKMNYPSFSTPVCQTPSVL